MIFYEKKDLFIKEIESTRDLDFFVKNLKLEVYSNLEDIPLPEGFILQKDQPGTYKIIEMTLSEKLKNKLITEEEFNLNIKLQKKIRFFVEVDPLITQMTRLQIIDSDKYKIKIEELKKEIIDKSFEIEQAFLDM